MVSLEAPPKFLGEKMYKKKSPTRKILIRLKDKIIDWRIPIRNQIELALGLSILVKDMIYLTLLAILFVSPIWMIFIPYLELLTIYGRVLIMLLIIITLNIIYNIAGFKKAKVKWLMDNVCIFNQYE